MEGAGGSCLPCFLVFLCALGNAKYSRKEEGREGIGEKEEKWGKVEKREGGKEGVRRQEEILFLLFFLGSDHYNDKPSNVYRLHLL